MFTALFFLIAFIITLKEQDIFPVHALRLKLNLSDEK